MKHIDHIGIAIKNLEASIPLFESLLNTVCYKRETVSGEGITTAFLKTGETKIELLQDEKGNGIINKFIEKKGEGIHHIAFEVENIQDEIARLKEAGFTILNEEPRKGADNKMVCFLHPRSTNSVLIELCEQIKINPA
ncbi:MAG: methylmalonyl-CoA epimerase [Parafilimonas sp.]